MLVSQWTSRTQQHQFQSFRLKIAREEVRLRCEALEQDLERLRMRQDDLQSAAEQTRSLKVN